MRRRHSTFVTQLRAIVQAEQSVARALKALRHKLPADQRNKIGMIDCAREAFCLTLHEAGLIAGWDASGAAEISDERLDELVMPAIMSHRDEWADNEGN
jgi:hypothetical protein